MLMAAERRRHTRKIKTDFATGESLLLVMKESASPATPPNIVNRTNVLVGIVR